MKNKITFIVFFTFFSIVSSQAQFLKDALNNTKDKAKSKSENEARRQKNKATGGMDLKNPISRQNMGIAKNVLGDKLSEYSQRIDATSFNYAISVTDNSSLYENKSVGKEILQKVNFVNQSTDSNTETPIQQASGWNQWGEMMYASYKFKTSESGFNKAQNLIESNSLQNEPLYSLLLSNYGLMYQAAGRYEKAEEYSLKALASREKNADTNPEAYAASLNNLAVLYKETGKYDESEKLFEKALQYQQKTDDGKKSDAYPILLNNQAMLYQTLGRYNDAEPILKNALSLAEKIMGEKSSNYVRLMVNQAFLYKDMKRNDEAEQILLKAIKIKERQLSTKSPDYANLLNNIAALYMQTGKDDKVEDYLKKSSAIYKDKFGDNHPSYADAISNLGNYYRIKGKLNDAEPLLQKVITIRKEKFGENHPKYIDGLESIALLKWQQKKSTDAANFFKQVLDKELKLVQNFFPSMSESEKEKFWDKLFPKFQKFYSFAVENYKENPALLGDMYTYQLSTKALLLSASSKIKSQILASSDADLKKKYNAWLDGKENLSKIYTYSKEELLEEGINRDSLEKAVNALEKDLSKSTLFQAGYQQETITYKSIQAKLKVDEAAIEIIRFPKFNITAQEDVNYAALVLTKDKPEPQLALIENGKELDKKYYAYYKNAITKKQEDKISYDQYWFKIDKLLAAKKTIYLSCDGIYNQINVNTLQVPSSAAYVLDSKNIVIVTNTKDILQKSLPNTKPKAILIGFPDYGVGESIAALPGTKVEMTGINTVLLAKGYKTQIFLQKNASETNVKSISNPKVLHIATHGFFLKDVDDVGDEKVFGIEPDKAKENPLLRAGLLLSGAEATVNNIDTKEVKSKDNGILSAYEAMSLTLDQTDLVVLSACETGLGDIKNGEGVYGLQRAFKVAGAKALLMSLWKVNDEATQQLMTSFYKNWTATGNKIQAFKTAQLELKTKFKNPYYWGAFVLVGIN